MLFIDTETTGVKANDEILNLAIIDSDGIILVDSYFTPMLHSKWPEAEKINGISPAFIAAGDYPYAHEAAPEIADIIKGEQLCFYNAEFDMPFIVREFFSKTPTNLVHCCMNRWAIHKGIPSDKPYHKTGFLTHKLTVAAQETNYAWIGKAHGA